MVTMGRSGRAVWRQGRGTGGGGEVRRGCYVEGGGVERCAGAAMVEGGGRDE
jgi:hypothetical protein